MQDVIVLFHCHRNDFLTRNKQMKDVIVLFHCHRNDFLTRNKQMKTKSEEEL